MNVPESNFTGTGQEIVFVAFYSYTRHTSQSFFPRLVEPPGVFALFASGYSVHPIVMIASELFQDHPCYKGVQTGAAGHGCPIAKSIIFEAPHIGRIQHRNQQMWRIYSLYTGYLPREPQLQGALRVTKD